MPKKAKQPEDRQVAIKVKMPESLRVALKMKAAEERTNVEELVRRLIRKYLGH